MSLYHLFVKMKRRHLLGISSVLFASGSGCTAITDGEQNFLGEITVGNRDTEPHIAIVAVEHNDDVAMKVGSGTVQDVRESVHVQPALPEVVQRAFSGPLTRGGCGHHHHH